MREELQGGNHCELCARIVAPPLTACAQCARIRGFKRALDSLFGKRPSAVRDATAQLDRTQAAFEYLNELALDAPVTDVPADEAAPRRIRRRE